MGTYFIKLTLLDINYSGIYCHNFIGTFQKASLFLCYFLFFQRQPGRFAEIHRDRYCEVEQPTWFI